MFSTTKIIDYLKKHPDEYSHYVEKKIRDLKELEKQKEQTAFKQLTMVETHAKVKIWDINDHCAVRILRLVGEMIATENHHFH